MDFGKLLSVAQRNAASSTSSEPKAERDPKAKRKIEKMLKVIRSANKSVLDDAIDTQDTAVTLQGPEQPDEDDYGYTSNVASAIYQQLMDKYKATPEEKKFKDGEKRTMSKEEMQKAKARVKDALNRVQEEENAPRTRKRKDGTGGEGSTREETAGSSKKVVGPDRYDPEEERKKEAEAKAKEEAAKKKAKRPQGPPPPDFATLLKLAEQKQMEPVKLETPLDTLEKKKKEPERLMTKKEKKDATSGKPSTSSSSSAKVAPPASNGQPKSRPFPPADVQRTRQFPPPDVQRKRPGPPPSASSSSQFKKRRPVIEDSDSEYDSEMDDFIDDEGAEEDISSHIRAIFGYDKSRYRDEDFDDRTMESNFAQVQREEYISKKIGLQEDLEDMRLEEEEKRQKALAKKKAAAAAKGSGGKRK
ncbi:hypothetical protein quinque_015038 [Culex quinquefasciatus]